MVFDIIRCNLFDQYNTCSCTADPKDSGLDFRELLRHKDVKNKKKKKENPDWGELKARKQSPLLISSPPPLLPSLPPSSDRIGA